MSKHLVQTSPSGRFLANLGNGHVGLCSGVGASVARCTVCVVNFWFVTLQQEYLLLDYDGIYDINAFSDTFSDAFENEPDSSILRPLDC